MPEPQSKKISVWLLSDGKAGHENQSLGLIEALARRMEVQVTKIPSLSFFECLLAWLFKKLPFSKTPQPDFIIAAGHKTHLSLLSAGRASGAKTLLLMQPSLPVSWFDLCLIPEHDQPEKKPNVIMTRGVLNRIFARQSADQKKALMLIGGPSSHFEWSDENMLEQIKTVLKQSPDLRWTIADSRRTPQSMRQALKQLHQERIEYVDCEKATPDWLKQTLPDAATVWVSEDSVSMVYEALTSQVKVGLFTVPTLKDSRVSRGVNKLIEEGFVTSFPAWQNNGYQLAHKTFSNEAERCADEVAGRWLNN